MSTSVYVDKENTPATGNVPRMKPGVQGSKLFQRGNVHPKNALGSIKQELGSARSALTCLGSINKQPASSNIGPIKRLFNESNTSGACTKNTRESLALQSHKSEAEPINMQEETEMMPQCKDPVDDYEDIVPKSQRLSTYLDQLLSWRPSRLCPVSYDSDEEPEVLGIDLPLPELSFETKELCLVSEDHFDHGVLALSLSDICSLRGSGEELDTLPEL